MAEGDHWWLAATYGYPAGFEIRRPVRSFWLTVYEVLVFPRVFHSRLETGCSEYPAMSFLLASVVLALTGNETLFEARFFGGGRNPALLLGSLSPVFVSCGTLFRISSGSLCWFPCS